MAEKNSRVDRLREGIRCVKNFSWWRILRSSRRFSQDESVVIVQTTCKPQDTNLMQLAFMTNAAKHNGARKVIAIVPTLPMPARQDVPRRRRTWASKPLCFAAFVMKASCMRLVSCGLHVVCTMTTLSSLRNLLDERRILHQEKFLTQRIPSRSLSTRLFFPPILVTTDQEWLSLKFPSRLFCQTLGYHSERIITLSIITPSMGLDITRFCEVIIWWVSRPKNLL